MEAVAARDAACVETEELDRNDLFAVEGGEMLDRTDEGDRRLAVGELVGHDRRNREVLDGGIESGLEAFGEHDARTDAFKDELFILAVVDALELGDVARDAQGCIQ